MPSPNASRSGNNSDRRGGAARTVVYRRYGQIAKSTSRVPERHQGREDSPDKWQLKAETADHGMPYSAAVVPFYSFVMTITRAVPASRLLDLVSRVRCIASAEADAHEKDYNLCDFEVVLKSGMQKSIRVEYHRGHPRNPMTDAEMEEKFRSLARRYLSADRIDALLRQLWSLEDLPKAGTLVEMTAA